MHPRRNKASFIWSACEYCGKPYRANRNTSKYCSVRCRYRLRMEDSKFKYDGRKLPRSGIAGVTFHRILERWVVTDEKRTYRGSRKELADAIAFKVQLDSSPTSSVHDSAN